MSCQNPSPLRYPGGKYKISPLVEYLLKKCGSASVYVEPFAGGAGVALDLLFRDIVKEIVINDADRAIASFWKYAVTQSEEFVERILATPVTLDEWKKQKYIYEHSSAMSLDYAFASFFLNRTNHSGILASGPIGGQAQQEWKLDARYNKEHLARKIVAIGKCKNRIHIYNRDVMSFIRRQLPQYANNAFVYFDPPYYRKGKVLYKNFFTHQKHEQLCAAIRSIENIPWIVSYDAVSEIRNIYSGIPCREFNLSYSLANNGTGREIMFFSENLSINDNEIDALGMSKMFEGI